MAKKPASTDTLEEQDKKPEIATETLLGDVQRVILDELKAAPSNWSQMDENEQDEALKRIDTRVRDAIRRTVHLIASRGFIRIPGKIDQISVKDAAKAQIAVNSSDDKFLDLVAAQGSYCTIVLADIDQFMGGTETIKAEPNQPDLMAKLKDIGDSDAAK